MTKTEHQSNLPTIGLIENQYTQFTEIHDKLKGNFNIIPRNKKDNYLQIIDSARIFLDLRYDRQRRYRALDKLAELLKKAQLLLVDQILLGHTSYESDRLDGFDLVRKLLEKHKTQFSHIPVVFLSNSLSNNPVVRDKLDRIRKFNPDAEYKWANKGLTGDKGIGSESYYNQYVTEKINISLAKTEVIIAVFKVLLRLLRNPNTKTLLNEDDLNNSFGTTLNNYFIDTKSTYVVKDQTRAGKSEGGKQAGQLDFLIESIDETKQSYIIEAYKLDNYIKTGVITRHNHKLAWNYNYCGNPIGIMLIYVKLRTKTFENVWESFKKNVPNICDLSKRFEQKSIKFAISYEQKDNTKRFIYHFFIDLSQ